MQRLMLATYSKESSSLLSIFSINLALQSLIPGYSSTIRLDSVDVLAFDDKLLVVGQPPRSELTLLMVFGVTSSSSKACILLKTENVLLSNGIARSDMHSLTSCHVLDHSQRSFQCLMGGLEHTNSLLVTFSINLDASEGKILKDITNSRKV